MAALGAALGLLAAPLAAQTLRPLDADSRVETIEWGEGKVIPLRTTPGGALTLVFSPGEAVQAVQVGDTEALRVTIAPQADSLLILTRRVPLADGIEVRTQLRNYRFRVVVGPANDVAYVVRFSMPAGSSVRGELNGVAAEKAMPAGLSTLYAIKGETNLRPVRVGDDGIRTYIEWGNDQALPAVFAVNALGEEESVDAYMRGGVMVIDRVYGRLIFRIGKHKAQADRPVAGKRRGL